MAMGQGQTSAHEPAVWGESLPGAGRTLWAPSGRDSLLLESQDAMVTAVPAPTARARRRTTAAAATSSAAWPGYADSASQPAIVDLFRSAAGARKGASPPACGRRGPWTPRRQPGRQCQVPLGRMTARRAAAPFSISLSLSGCWFSWSKASSSIGAPALGSSRGLGTRCT